jgi:hypothetical protein
MLLLPVKIMERTSHMRNAIKYFVAAFVVISAFWLAACDRIVSGTEKETVLAFSEPTVDNLLAGWTVNDYAVFSRDFDTDIQEEIPATGFAALRQDIDNKLGNYISRKVDRVARSDEFYVVDYQAKFDHEEPVKITVAFHASDHSIAFLAIDSEKVSWSTFE